MQPSCRNRFRIYARILCNSDHVSIFTRDSLIAIRPLSPISSSRKRHIRTNRRDRLCVAANFLPRLVTVKSANGLFTETVLWNIGSEGRLSPSIRLLSAKRGVGGFQGKGGRHDCFSHYQHQRDCWNNSRIKLQGYCSLSRAVSRNGRDRCNRQHGWSRDSNDHIQRVGGRGISSIRLFGWLYSAILDSAILASLAQNRWP